jgi:dihydrofolate synthase/folylpolyglutamate synthase
MDERYRETLAALYGRLNYERTGMPRAASELRLGRTRRLLHRLGDPHDGLRVVHVAGTKGKGSTAAMVAAALSAAGVRTGLFCSPHLHRLEERFVIDGQPIVPEALVALAEEVLPVADALDAADPHARRPLTFFEVTTAMGLLHFAQRGVGAVVLEVGLGGRLDSTNIVRPRVAVITSISLDHTRQLGTTTAAIAAEKAGILKRGGAAVVGARDLDARRSIQAVAARRRASLRVIGSDFEVAYLPPTPPLVEPTPGQADVQTWRRAWGRFRLPLLGDHQADNAAVALAALDALAEVEPSLAVDAPVVVRGWSALRFPARVEVLGRRPWLVIDGAHNVASAEALARTLRTHVPPASPRVLVFGTTREKDLTGQLRALLPWFDAVVATRYVENPRAVPPVEVAAAVAALADTPIRLAADPAEALDLACSQTPPEGLVCVTGSLFLAAEARAAVLDLPSIPAVQPAASPPSGV